MHSKFNPDRTPAMNNAFVTLLRRAKRHLSSGQPDDHRPTYICVAIRSDRGFFVYDGDATNNDINDLTTLIYHRLDGVGTVEQFLMGRGIDTSKYHPTVIQEYRQLWVDMLIEEFS